MWWFVESVKLMICKETNLQRINRKSLWTFNRSPIKKGKKKGKKRLDSCFICSCIVTCRTVGSSSNSRTTKKRKKEYDGWWWLCYN